MYFNKTVSVVMATHTEKTTVRKIINDFFKTGFVDEVIAVNNNAEDGTKAELRKTKAKILYEKRQGSGYAFFKGVKAARGYFVITCEPDGTYLPSDIERFLVYAKDFEVVLGSRSRQGTFKAIADVSILRKFANTFEAKTIEILFNTKSLSEVGCNYKLFSRPALRKIIPAWKMRNSLFTTELILIAVVKNLRFIEVPITFCKRVGQSAFCEHWYDLVKWGIIMQAYIIWYWSNWIAKKIIRKLN